jgi:hypothetical protein
MHVKMVETLYQSGEVTGNKIDAATASEILLRDPLMYRNWTGRLSVCEKNVLTVFGKMTKAKHDRARKAAEELAAKTAAMGVPTSAFTSTTTTTMPVVVAPSLRVPATTTTTTTTTRMAAAPRAAAATARSDQKLGNETTSTSTALNPGEAAPVGRGRGRRRALDA